MILFRKEIDVKKEIEQIKKELKEQKEKIEKIEEKVQFSFQKLGILKYNAIEGTGGNQSFSLAILDEKDDGFLITNLVFRDGSKIFVKPIFKGQSSILLTSEERKAIELAKNEWRKRKTNQKTTSSGNSGTH